MPKTRIITYVGITAVIGLASLPAFLMLAPLLTVGTDSAHAEGAASATQNLVTTATVDPTIALSANSVDIRIRPSALGTFKTGTVTANVSTNSDKGYTLYLSSNGDSLKHSDRDDTIKSITATSTGINMSMNTWGYRLGASEGTEEERDAADLIAEYSPILGNYEIIKDTTAGPTPSGGDSNTVTFGVKVDTSIPSGTYSGQVMFTAISKSVTSGATAAPWSDSAGKLISTMQEMTPSVCATVPTPAVTATGSDVPEVTLRDIRDNSTYKVRKLADGNCWMVESLKIAGEDSEHPITLTSADSNVTTNFDLPAIVPFGSTINSTDTAYVSGGGTGGTDNATGITGVNGTVLYNWFAATAGTGTASMTDGDSAPSDICPKGWHLPNKEGNTSWNKLLRMGQGAYEITASYNSYSSSKVSWGTYIGISTAASNPVGLQLTGNFWESKLHGTAGGYYWSRTAASADNAYNLAYNSNNVYPQGNNDKAFGRGIRCVADDKTTLANATYMQDVSSCPASLPEGAQYVLKDKRDNKEYTVARTNHSASDSLCWMMQNLAIGGDEEMTLKADLTDSSSDYVLPASSTSGFSNDNIAYVYIDTSTNNYGGYYSYPAATAGENPSSGDASKSICPKGWRLPTKDELNNLKSYKSWGNSSAWTSGIFKGQRAGYYGSSSPYNVGSEGKYWLSTVYNSNSAYNLDYNSSDAAIDYNRKRDGYSVRCVFES